jgi:hypothetical protein
VSEVVALHRVEHDVEVLLQLEEALDAPGGILGMDVVVDGVIPRF